MPEERPYVVCMRAKDYTPIFHDNVESPCSRCGETVTHRPHIPKNGIIICADCAVPFLKEALKTATKEDPIMVTVTPQTEEELRQFALVRGTKGTPN